MPRRDPESKPKQSGGKLDLGLITDEVLANAWEPGPKRERDAHRAHKQRKPKVFMAGGDEH